MSDVWRNTPWKMTMTPSFFFDNQGPFYQGLCSGLLPVYTRPNDAFKIMQSMWRKAGEYNDSETKLWQELNQKVKQYSEQAVTHDLNNYFFSSSNDRKKPIPSYVEKTRLLSERGKRLSEELELSMVSGRPAFVIEPLVQELIDDIDKQIRWHQRYKKTCIQSYNRRIKVLNTHQDALSHALKRFVQLFQSFLSKENDLYNQPLGCSLKEAVLILLRPLRLNSPKKQGEYDGVSASFIRHLDSCYAKRYQAIYELTLALALSPKVNRHDKKVSAFLRLLPSPEAFKTRLSDKQRDVGAFNSYQTRKEYLSAHINAYMSDGINHGFKNNRSPLWARLTQAIRDMRTDAESIRRCNNDISRLEQQKQALKDYLVTYQSNQRISCLM